MAPSLVAPSMSILAFSVSQSPRGVAQDQTAKKKGAVARPLGCYGSGVPRAVAARGCCVAIADSVGRGYYGRCRYRHHRRHLSP